jgi:TolB-like protein/tetratricopeptide (TPR) repeat protein
MGRVLRAVAAYGVVAFAIVEITHPLTVALHLPEWTLTLVVLLLGLGFPVMAVVAWITSGSPDAHGDVAADAKPLPAPPDGAQGPTRRLPLRVALLLVGVGLVVAAPGIVYFLVLRDRGGAGSARVAEERSIAVLPFADLSPGRDQEYFADGIAEEILNALAHVDGLRVSGRTSSFSYKSKPATIAEIGRELKVATVLEGSVRKEGNRVRITAQMIDVERGGHIWSDSYDRELTGIFAVQDDIARAVVDALKVKLLPGGGTVVKAHRKTSPEAYNEYLLARHFFDLGTADGMSRAVVALEKAIALDPDYAPAWAWLSVSILNSAVYLSQGGAPAAVDEAARRATAAAEKAVALAPDLAECWSARAWMRTSIAWDWAGARSDFQRALALNARDPNILVRQSHLLAVTGNLPEAIAFARKAIEIDPLYAWAWFFLANFQNGSNQPELARDAATRALEIAPEHIYATKTLGDAQLVLGQPGAALATYQRDKVEAIRLTGTALALNDLGDDVQARKALDELRGKFADSEAYEIARVYAWRGDRDGAFDWLERAYAQRGGSGVSRLLLRDVKHDPLLRKIRGDPRYATLLERMNLPLD